MHSDYKTDKCIADTVMALGNFDGVHLGHRVIIEETVRQSADFGVKSSVLLLNPHPIQYLKKARESFLLTTIQDKRAMFKELGVECIFIEPFDSSFAALSPDAFVREYLTRKFRVRGVVVGFDYSFGRRGEGNTRRLQELGVQEGFSVTVREAVAIKGQTISSTLIRRKIALGMVEEAAIFLGYPYHIRGKVISGSRLGRTLGFPTANLKIDPFIILPKKGVYLTAVRCRGKAFYGLTNVGFKPTVSGQHLSVEVHILNFSANIYDEELIVFFLQRIRNEKTFRNTDELKEQIIKDMRMGEGLIRGKYSGAVK